MTKKLVKSKDKEDRYQLIHDLQRSSFKFFLQGKHPCGTSWGKSCLSGMFFLHLEYKGEKNNTLSK